MAVKVIGKKQTQQLIRDMRKAGYTVDKVDGIYKVVLDGVKLFSAVPGYHGYLCQFDDNFLVETKR